MLLPKGTKFTEEIRHQLSESTGDMPASVVCERMMEKFLVVFDELFERRFKEELVKYYPDCRLPAPTITKIQDKIHEYILRAGRLGTRYADISKHLRYKVHKDTIFACLDVLSSQGAIVFDKSRGRWINKEFSDSL